ncbi:Nucleotidyltransferase domain-containing protein [Paraburkholderia fungorum]|uniref:Nucleotidyltransferase domain-containing protein n=1 Tax=Paraburkholderia fungorum TaxID=134537 RepID=A0A1H1JZ52_9BURK|nr:nucleotidyltransferase domain-containing protein [Paraburkholderia fungorum]SDR55060.1 Nucleotidyltransferase domain-containing protein [Paraburkholderia fungorum]
MRLEDILKKWRDNPSTTRQMALLERISAALEASPSCIGAVVVGSFAKGNADRVSDVDLVVFCSDGAENSLISSIEQQITQSDIFIKFDGIHDPKSPFQKLIFEDFTSIEFHVISPDTELILEQPFVQIVNRDRCLESRASSRLASAEHDTMAYRYGDRFLAWELFTCLKWLWRGDFKTAKRYLVNLGRAIEASEDTDGSAVA